jgi:exodeoxyribonuclease V
MLVAPLDDNLLTDQQRSAIDRIISWTTDPNAPQVLKVSGRAGTGKTTIIRKATEHLDPHIFRVASLSGKATAVLRRKGLDAQTLHSLMYIPLGQDEHGCLRFEKVDNLPCDIVFVDEGSTIYRALHEDLLSYGVKVAYFGDHWQLEPPEEDINLMQDPDILLEQVHRQASNSPILRFAEAVHYGRETFHHREVPGLTVAHAPDFWRYMWQSDIAIVGYNETRHQVNRMFRQRYGHRGPGPNVGEKVICLRNNRDYGVYNGLTATVIRVRALSDQGHHIDIEDEVGNRWYNLPTLLRQYGVNSLAGEPFYGYLLFDYAYAITNHKAQGSEWKTVAVMEEVASIWSFVRWAFTAITRASEQLYYCR